MTSRRSRIRKQFVTASSQARSICGSARLPRQLLGELLVGVLGGTAHQHLRQHARRRRLAREVLLAAEVNAAAAQGMPGFEKLAAITAKYGVTLDLPAA